MAKGTPASTVEMPRGQPVEIRKLRRDGSLRIAYRGLMVLRDGELRVVEARWAGGPWRGGPAPMDPGDPCREFFRVGQGVVALRLMDPSGRLRGVYVDLAAPVVEEDGALSYRDAVLDVFVAPDGSMRLLDTEEFLERVRSGARADEARHAVAALGDLLAWWSSGKPPFDGVAPARAS